VRGLRGVEYRPEVRAPMRNGLADW
jgi:hypothetical protein